MGVWFEIHWYIQDVTCTVSISLHTDERPKRWWRAYAGPRKRGRGVGGWGPSRMPFERRVVVDSK